MRIDVHLTGHQNVFFEAGEEREAAARANDRTKVLQWLPSNQQYPTARNISYLEFTCFFTWQGGNWKPRDAFKVRPSQDALRTVALEYDFSRLQRATDTVSRIYTVIPREGERYFLRTLLLHEEDATCLEDLCTVDGDVETSFRETCLARGLLQDDSQWKLTMQNAFRSSFELLTEIIATLIAFCNEAGPVEL